jgi:hypothetical protein
MLNLWYELNMEFFSWTPQHTLPLDSKLGELQSPGDKHEEVVQVRLRVQRCTAPATLN